MKVGFIMGAFLNLTLLCSSAWARQTSLSEMKRDYDAIHKPRAPRTQVDYLNSCEAVVQRKAILVTGKSSSVEEDILLGDAVRLNPTFLIPAYCDLLCTSAYLQYISTSMAPSWSRYIGGRALIRYGDEVMPYLEDVYVDPQIPSVHIEDEKLLEKRRNVAFDLFMYYYWGKVVGTSDGRTFVRKQGEVYRSYGRRMKALAERVDEATLSPIAVPDAPATTSEGNLRRACEIMLRLEAAPKTPLKVGEEAAFVNELATLHQPLAATTLLGYLHQPIGGVEAKTIQEAVAMLGEEAVPSVLRYLRTDKRTSDEVRQALPILVALCKTPDATKARLLQTAQTYEDGAKRFENGALHWND